MKVYVIIRVYSDCDVHYELFDNIYFTSEEKARAYMEENCKCKWEEYYISTLNLKVV